MINVRFSEAQQMEGAEPLPLDDYEVHPVADLFPMLAEDELNELAADIKARGLLQPIVLDDEGRVLDGRNRLAACRLAEVEPTFTTYEGDDPDGYAVAVNIARRHLSTGARAIIAAKAIRMSGRKFDGRRSRFANLGGHITRSRLSEAETVIDYAPSYVPAVLTGVTPLSVAVVKAREEKRIANPEAAAA